MGGRMLSSFGGQDVRISESSARVINKVFDILELIVVRIVLLGLAAFGAYALLLSHHP
jgi:hypothetical protein